ncbi:hypothetical protein [Chryseobacterium profundimaris]|uniref:Uncharacterized protein n=1 Tax=Chryseobacterium profundimaris TaxID=1387275 RepID=A0ABY1NRF2_9FLAO|nr:hypothetical protein [Chryseobacterium profundimaris]SMP16412.1 hypothetical protein SAMN06264346_10433 [Chryseobacterium profundimaris]
MRVTMEYDIPYHETIERFNQDYFSDYEYYTKREIVFADYLKILEKNYSDLIDFAFEIIELYSGNNHIIKEENKKNRDSLLYELNKYFEFYELLQKLTNKKFENYFESALDKIKKSKITNQKEHNLYFESVDFTIYYNFINENPKLFLEGFADEMINIRAAVRNKIMEFKLINRSENVLEGVASSFDSTKIKIKGSLQSVGFLISELIDKGYIVAPKRNGKNNTSAISRMILEHFEFVDREEQPKTEDIRKTLFTDNRLSVDKQSLFRIPNRNTLNES